MDQLNAVRAVHPPPACSIGSFLYPAMAFDVGTMTGGGGGGGYGGGTGSKLTRATIIVAGVAALAASLLSIV